MSEHEKTRYSDEELLEFKKIILDKLEKAKAELFNLRFQQATGQLENPSRMKEIRKTIARIKTVITERELSEAK